MVEASKLPLVVVVPAKSEWCGRLQAVPAEHLQERAHSVVVVSVAVVVAVVVVVVVLLLCWLCWCGHWPMNPTIAGCPSLS